MSQKRTLGCDLTDNSPAAKIVRLDTSPDAFAETGPFGNTQPGHPSHVCALLAFHDILTILVCNDAFVATIGIATLALLPRLAPQYKDILSLVSEDGRLCAVQSHIDGRPTIPNSKRIDFRDVLNQAEEFIDANDFLQGVFFFLTRRNGYPTSFEAYQKELPLWEAAAGPGGFSIHSPQLNI
ncbi:uncharacterized protein BJ171DRAFT_473298 [Polychytrium aggregatum]|uniref:uncharacterized protein n=1 Tax=Polychytrium aggregatum TaxID=110093 RepID=UPI0022FE2993|nr:uncharacterized protein BJ171DRAFT_473298 [Polychytrium aggregatum]KAI9206270.1 hypothetical protein BJ171DRAFT_473298 [Polychytrium aggregatum]